MAVTMDDGEFLTIPEAGERLRISKNAAYEAAKLYRDSGGAAGLPNIKIGGSLRVPQAVLERMTQLELPFDSEL